MLLEVEAGSSGALLRFTSNDTGRPSRIRQVPLVAIAVLRRVLRSSLHMQRVLANELDGAGRLMRLLLLLLLST